MMVLFKGRTALPDGTERIWHGQKFRKINGKWKPIGATRGRGRPRKDSQPRKEAETDEPKEPKKAEEETKVEKKPDEEPKVDKKPEADGKKKNKKIEIDTSKHDAMIEAWEQDRDNWLNEWLPDMEQDIKDLEATRDALLEDYSPGKSSKEYADTIAMIEHKKDLIKQRMKHVADLENKIKKEKVMIKREKAEARGTKLGRKKSPEKLFAEEIVARFDAKDQIRRNLEHDKMFLRTIGRGRFSQETVPELDDVTRTMLMAVGISDFDQFEKVLLDENSKGHRDTLIESLQRLDQRYYEEYKKKTKDLQEYRTTVYEVEYDNADKEGKEQIGKERNRLGTIQGNASDDWQRVGRLRGMVSFSNWMHELPQEVRQKSARSISSVMIEGSSIGLEFKSEDKFIGSAFFAPDEALAMVSAFMKGSARTKYMLAIKNSKLYQEWEIKSGKSPLGEVLKKYEEEIGLGITLQGVSELTDLHKRGSLKKLRKQVDKFGSAEKKKLFFDECMNIFTTLKKHMDMTKYVPPDGKKLKIMVLPAEGNDGIGGTYSEYDNTINIKETTKGAITHEIGHYFWERSPEMQKEFMQWVEDSGLKKKIDTNTYDPREDDAEWDNFIDTSITNGMHEAEKKLAEVESYGTTYVTDREGLRNGTQLLVAFLSAKAKSDKGYFEKGRRRHHDSGTQQAPATTNVSTDDVIAIKDQSDAVLGITAAEWKDKYLPDMDVTTIYTQLLGLRTGMADMHKQGGSLAREYAKSLTWNHYLALNGGGVNYRDGADYWQTPTEIFARTFRNFISHKATGDVRFRDSEAMTNLYNTDYKAYRPLHEAEYVEYTNTYGWGFADVDPDPKILNYGDGALEKIYKKYIGGEVIKAMTRLVWLLEKGRKPDPEGTIKEWHGQKFKKTGKKWIPIGATRGKGRPQGSKNKVKLIAGTPEEKQELIKTKEFRNWFGKSKVVKHNGTPSDNYNITPVKVYHGTSAGGYRVFDPEKVGAYNIYGTGFYFTEDQEIAEEYKSTKDASLEDRAKAAVGISINGLRMEYIPDKYNIKAILDDPPRGYSILKNPNWGKSMVRALDESHVPGKGYEVSKFFELYSRYQTEDNSDRSATAIGKSAMLMLLRQTIQGFDFVAPEPEIFECFIKMENPYNMDAEIDETSYNELKDVLLKMRFSPYLDDLFSNTENDLANLGLRDYADGLEVYSFDVMKKIKKYMRRKMYSRDIERGGAVVRKAGDPVFPVFHQSAPDVLTGADVQYILTNGQHGSDVNAINQAIRFLGYDGIHHTGGWNIGTKAHSVWIPFGSTQIKSTKNEGLFDPDNPDIYKSLTWSGYSLQGRRKIHGMRISIENKKGSVRSGVDKDGREWKTKMHYDYGYIRGTVGKDKDHLDCYVGPDPESGNVFIVHQNDPVTGKFDEDKVMLGFNTPEEAKEAHLKQYDRPGFFGSIDATDIETFKKEIYKNKNKGCRLVIRKSKMSELASELEDQGLYRKGMKKTWTLEQEEEGIKVELEHTGDREVARQIAMDHLVEDAEYYKKLKKMEE